MVRKLTNRDRLSPAQGVVWWNDEHHLVAGQVTKRQIRSVRLPPEEAEANLAPLDLTNNVQAIAHAGTNVDVGVLLTEVGQEDRQQMLAGNRTGGEEQFPLGRSGMAGDLLACLPVEVEDPLGVVVEFLACLGEEHAPRLSLEQGRAELLFEVLHTLADGCLRNA